MVCSQVFIIMFLLRISAYRYYRPQRSYGQGNVFTGMCLSTGGGRVSASVHAGMPYPPRDQADPPRTRQTPPRDQAHTPWDQAHTTPPGPGTHPRGPGRHPPRTRETPPGKQTPAYGLRAAGTHPTGMHSCFILHVP